MVSGFLKVHGSVFLLFAVLALAILPGSGRVALADAGQAAAASGKVSDRELTLHLTEKRKQKKS